MKKNNLIANLVIVARLCSSMAFGQTNHSVAENPCSFMSMEQRETFFHAEFDNTCIVDIKALSELEGSLNFVGSLVDDNYGQISVYGYQQYGVAVVETDLAAHLDQGNESPLILWAVGADLAILTAWMLAEMYAK